MSGGREGGREEGREEKEEGVPRKTPSPYCFQLMPRELLTGPTYEEFVTRVIC